MAESASDSGVPQEILDELSNGSAPSLPQISSSSTSEDDKLVKFFLCLVKAFFVHLDVFM